MKKDLIAINRKTEICGALKRLMRRKNIQKITIQELTDECGISRYTFYYHFMDIYDCLSWLLQDEIRKYSQQLSSNLSWAELALTFIQSAKENRSFYRHLLSSPRPELLHNIFRQEVRPLVHLYLSKFTEQHQYGLTDSYISFLADFFTSALGGMLTFMVQDDLNYSDALLVEYLHTILDENFEGIIRRAQQKGFCAQAVAVREPERAHRQGDWNDLL